MEPGPGRPELARALTAAEQAAYAHTLARMTRGCGAWAAPCPGTPTKPVPRRPIGGGGQMKVEATAGLLQSPQTRA
jgi:hypothetical protein